VALNLNLQSRMLSDDCGYLRQLLTRSRLERPLADVEKHIGHVDDEPARCLAGFEYPVELLHQLLPQAHLFRLCVFRIFSRLVDLSLSSLLLLSGFRSFSSGFGASAIGPGFRRCAPLRFQIFLRLGSCALLRRLFRSLLCLSLARCSAFAFT
jgi:hypothetical protein